MYKSSSWFKSLLIDGALFDKSDFVADVTNREHLNVTSGFRELL